MTQPVTDPQQTAADLRAAADALRKKGWTQFGLIDERGCLCLTAAIAYAVSGGTTHRPGELLLDAGGDFDRWRSSSDALRESIGVDGIVDWNDDHDRTADEVIAALETAAEQVATR